MPDIDGDGGFKAAKKRRDDKTAASNDRMELKGDEAQAKARADKLEADEAERPGLNARWRKTMEADNIPEVEIARATSGTVPIKYLKETVDMAEARQRRKKDGDARKVANDKVAADSKAVRAEAMEVVNQKNKIERDERAAKTEEQKAVAERAEAKKAKGKAPA